MQVFNEFKSVPSSARPKIRWWIPSTLTDINQAKREISMFKEAGFSGAEICARDVFNPTTQKIEKGWGTKEWGATVKAILEEAKKQDFEIDLMVLCSSPMMIDAIDDVDDPKGGARLELDGAYIDGITKENPYSGSLPLNEEAINDAKEMNGTCKLYAVTVAKYVDKEKHILSLSSARELNIGIDVVKIGEDSLSYSVNFVPEDNGEYVLFAWWIHPSKENCHGIAQLDFIGKYGTPLFIKYHEEEFLPSLGEMKDYVTSYFLDSIEWANHMDIFTDFRKMFIEKNGYDLTKYFPAIYDQDHCGCYYEVHPDFSFDEHSEKFANDYTEFLTNMYIENHIKPLKEFCVRNGITLRYQTTYGKFFELAKTAGYVDIPDTESLYGKDIIDFYRIQSGAAHITGKNIYSIEAAAEKPGRSNGGENSGNYVQGFKNQMWHLQRAYASGVNEVYFHGCRYRGHYYGPGNENGVLPGIHWPGYEPMDSVCGWSNSWDDRQPNWNGMSQLADSIGRMQYILKKGKPAIDLAIYHHSYLEVIDMGGAQKVFKSSHLEQLGYSYDFISPSHLTDFDVEFDGKCIFKNGPEYKALIFNEQNDLPYDAAKKVLSLAKSGLPIVFCNGVPSKPSFFGDNDIEGIMEEILSCKNVCTCTNIEEISEILKELNITPFASYENKTKVINIRRKTDDADYIYFYNYADADTFYMLDGAEKISFNVNLNTCGTPFVLDPWTGNISKAKVISKNENGILINLEIAANDSTIVMMLNADDKKLKEIETSKVLECEKTIQKEKSFELKNWTLDVESWTEGKSPVETNKEIVKHIALEKPVFWTKIDGLKSVSGVGYYKTEFDFEGADGAYLSVSEIEDSYILKVNGNKVNANQLSPTNDIGKYLKCGKNTLEIEVYSTILNAAIKYERDNNISDKGEYKDYGINGEVMIIPYTI